MNGDGGEDQERVPLAFSRSKPARMSPVGFERFVAKLFRQIAPQAADLKVRLHEVVSGADGEYDVDATVRFRLGGLDFLVLVEAKKHKNAIKREVVQVLHSKVLSVGAQKGVVVSTAPFQRGAMEFAREHGIGLIRVTDEVKFVVRMITMADYDAPMPTEPRATAWEISEDGTITGTVVQDDPERLLQFLT